MGFRYFVERVAADLRLRGWVRNLDDGRVEVYAVGDSDALSELSGYLWKGPRFADVRGVDEAEAPVEKISGFSIRG